MDQNATIISSIQDKSVCAAKLRYKISNMALNYISKVMSLSVIVVK